MTKNNHLTADIARNIIKTNSPWVSLQSIIRKLIEHYLNPKMFPLSKNMEAQIQKCWRLVTNHIIENNRSNAKRLNKKCTASSIKGDPFIAILNSAIHKQGSTEIHAKHIRAAWSYTERDDTNPVFAKFINGLTNIHTPILHRTAIIHPLEDIKSVPISEYRRMYTNNPLISEKSLRRILRRTFIQ